MPRDTTPRSEEPQHPTDAPPLDLPFPWVEIDGDEGLFYYNEETGESSWDFPEAPIEIQSEEESRDLDCEDAGQCGTKLAQENADVEPEPFEAQETADVEPEPFGAQVDILCHEVRPGQGEAPVCRAVVLGGPELRFVSEGLPVSLSCAPGVLLRVEAILSGERHEDCEEDEDWPGEGDAFLDLVSEDPSWPGLSEMEFDSLLTILLAGEDVEEAFCAAVSSMLEEVESSSRGRSQSESWDISELLQRAKDLFPGVIGDMELTAALSAIKDSVLLAAHYPQSNGEDVSLQDGATVRVSRKTSKTPLEETAMRAFQSVVKERPMKSEWPWNLLVDELARILGPRDSDLDRLMLEASPLFHFEYSEIRGIHTVRLRDKRDTARLDRNVDVKRSSQQSSSRNHDSDRQSSSRKDNTTTSKNFLGGSLTIASSATAHRKFEASSGHRRESERSRHDGRSRRDERHDGRSGGRSGRDEDRRGSTTSRRDNERVEDSRRDTKDNERRVASREEQRKATVPKERTRTVDQGCVARDLQKLDHKHRSGDNRKQHDHGRPETRDTRDRRDATERPREANRSRDARDVSKADQKKRPTDDRRQDDPAGRRHRSRSRSRGTDRGGGRSAQDRGVRDQRSRPSRDRSKHRDHGSDRVRGRESDSTQKQPVSIGGRLAALMSKASKEDRVATQAPAPPQKARASVVPKPTTSAHHIPPARAAGTALKPRPPTELPPNWARASKVSKAEDPRPFSAFGGPRRGEAQGGSASDSGSLSALVARRLAALGARREAA